jgi:pyridoxamine 5'-phosphate oxidase
MEPFSQELDLSSVRRDPIDQFHSWFDEVVTSGQPQPDAMALATVSPEGRVSNRIVLLKSCDQRGFTFFTNYQSRKSDELPDGAWAALTFFWQTLHRQVRIEGRVNHVSSEESAEYFATRPRGSQLGAWASPQSSEIGSREELIERLVEVDRRFEGEAVPCPPFWGGIRLEPSTIEFWQGRENRLHDRILYSFDNGTWRLSRLAP